MGDNRQPEPPDAGGTPDGPNDDQQPRPEAGPPVDPPTAALPPATGAGTPFDAVPHGYLPTEGYQPPGGTVPPAGSGTVPPAGYGPAGGFGSDPGLDPAAGPAHRGAAPPAPAGAPRRTATWKKVAGGVALAAVVGVGGVLAVTAASASGGTATAAASAPTSGGAAPTSGGAAGSAQDGEDSTGPRGGEGMTMPDGAGRGDPGGMFRLGGALHGEFVVPTADGGTTTVRLQNGSVTAVTADSLTVTSTDGFSASYAVGPGVDVSTLAEGDQVRLLATVEGDTATLTSVRSATDAMGGLPGGRGVMPGGEGHPEQPSPPTSEAPQTS